MLPSENLTKTEQYREVLDQTLLVSAYRMQISTLRSGLQGRVASGSEEIAQAIDLLHDVELHLTCYIERMTDQAAA